MAYTETTSTSWLGRIGNSIKGMLLGLVMVPIAFGVLIVNERNAVRDIRANDEMGNKVVSVASDVVNPADEGRLVHLNGPAHTGEILKNGEFGIEATAIRISWQSLIYQWEESSKQKTRKKLGGGEERVTTYQYKQVWSPTTISSSAFKEAGHDNIGQQTFTSSSAQAQHVTLGAYSLPRGLIAQIRSSEPLPLTQLPAPLAKRGQLSGGIFYTGDPASSQIGDEKVTFSITRTGNVSVIAVQSGGSFIPFMARNGKEKFLLYEGLLSAEQMVKGEEQKAMMLRWILRGAGGFAMFFGFVLLLKPLSVFADVVPLFGSLVGFATGVIALLLSGAISLFVIAISWLVFRPLLAIPLFLFALACTVVLVVMLARSRARMRAAVR